MEARCRTVPFYLSTSFVVAVCIYVVTLVLLIYDLQ
jgi:hypothetical protein